MNRKRIVSAPPKPILLKCSLMPFEGHQEMWYLGDQDDDTLRKLELLCIRNAHATCTIGASTYRVCRLDGQPVLLNAQWKVYRNPKTGQPVEWKLVCGAGCFCKRRKARVDSQFRLSDEAR